MYIVVKNEDLPGETPVVADITWLVQRLEEDASISEWTGWEAIEFTPQQLALVQSLPSFRYFGNNAAFLAWQYEHGAIPEEI